MIGVSNLEFLAAMGFNDFMQMYVTKTKNTSVRSNQLFHVIFVRSNPASADKSRFLQLIEPCGVVVKNHAAGFFRLCFGHQLQPHGISHHL